MVQNFHTDDASLYPDLGIGRDAWEICFISILSLGPGLRLKEYVVVVYNHVPTIMAYIFICGFRDIKFLFPCCK